MIFDPLFSHPLLSLTPNTGFKGELPEGRHLRIDNKKFYFDVGQNNLGIYMRISEVCSIHCLLFHFNIGTVIFQVKSNFRSSITIPEKSWVKFRDVFTDYVEKMNEATASGGGGGESSKAGTASSGDTASGGGGGGGSAPSK